MRSSSRIAAWVVGITVAANVLVLGCGSSGEETNLMLNATAFGNGAFVTVGDTDKAYTNLGSGSAPYPTGVSSLEDIAYGSEQGLFVAVGNGGVIVTSPDGIGWTQQASPTGANLNGVTSGVGQLIAVGDGGTIIVSNDGGLVWQQRTSGTDANLYGIVFGDEETFVAVGAGGTVVVSSDGGATWQADVVERAVTFDLYSVAFGRDPLGIPTWVAVGQNGIILVALTPSLWDVTGASILPNLNDVLFAQGLFLVVGDHGNILNSPNGKQFASSVANTGQFLFGAAFGNNQFLVVGSGARALTSIDGAIFQNGKI